MKRLFFLLLTLALAGPAAAQPLASLVADSVAVTEDGLLVAEGGVEVFQGTTRLRAARITYDGSTDTLTIEGPIELRDGDDFIILASQAELSEGLEDGILRSARLVLDQQLQIAAVEMQRVDGRYTQAFRVAATSCRVCDTDRPPLWQIRARRIIHDAEDEQIYFEDAQLRVLGLPVLYLPRLRLPDPGNERSTGFLAPEFRQSTLLGWGAKLPYFIEIGDHRDITITPFIATNSNTLELRFRRAFQQGELDWNLYVSNDDFSGRGTRAALLGDGRFDVPMGFELRFDIEVASDRSYLSDYSFSGKDRLDSAVALTRTQSEADTEIELVGIRTLREDEAISTFPSIILDARQDFRYVPQFIGGDGLLSFDFHTHYRESTETTDSDGDGIADGLDVTRVGVATNWNRQWILPSGLTFGTSAELGADFFAFSDDPSRAATQTRAQGGAGVTLGYPIMGRSTDGALHILEPRIQLAGTGATNADIPNEDSTRVEFDEGNLFSLNRAPGSDAVEDGTRVDLGVTWNRIVADGWDTALTVGRVQRLSGDNAFTAASGLGGDGSAWLISGNLQTAGPYDFIGRVTIDDTLAVIKNDLRVAFNGDRLRLASSFAYLAADAEEDRTSSASELTFDSSFDFNANWTGAADFRYDFETDTASRAGLALTYFNECVQVALSASRNFTSSSNVTPSTEFGLSVGLQGFGTGSDARSRAPACR